ncbi:MAG: HAD family phosphatase [Clostridia bacterium]|nr:HAD family phosphatase [Clostridia bacterium]
MKIKGAIFDMDGTLLDSMAYWNTVGIDYLERQGIKFDNEKENYVLYVGIPRFTEYCNEKYGLNKTYEEVLRALHDIVAEKYNTVVKLKPGALEMLERFKQNGVKMCIATATEQNEAKGVLKRLGVLDYFSEVFTTTIVGADKSSPLIYEVALEHLGTKKDETYIFEDAWYAIKTAHDNDFKVIGIEDKNTVVPTSEIVPLCTYFLYEKDKYNTSFLD